jgi:hypothetical protein
VPLSRGELGIVDIFFGIFGHHPRWIKLLLIVRNKVASLAGLEAPTASEILHVEIRDRYVVGDKIGVWPIFGLSDDEVVAGRNNKSCPPSAPSITCPAKSIFFSSLHSTNTACGS